VASGSYLLPKGIKAAGIISIASGRPYNIVAGTDWNGDGDAGSFPPDRARRIPADPRSSIARNSGRLPAEATVDVRVSRRFHGGGALRIDAVLDVFNLFNRTNFTEVNNIFGTEAYPTEPLPTFGRFERAGPQGQVQLGVRVGF